MSHFSCWECHDAWAALYVLFPTRTLVLYLCAFQGMQCVHCMHVNVLISRNQVSAWNWLKHLCPTLRSSPLLNATRRSFKTSTRWRSRSQGRNVIQQTFGWLVCNPCRENVASPARYVCENKQKWFATKSHAVKYTHPDHEQKRFIHHWFHASWSNRCHTVLTYYIFCACMHKYTHPSTRLLAHYTLWLCLLVGFAIDLFETSCVALMREIGWNYAPDIMTTERSVAFLSSYLAFLGLSKCTKMSCSQK